MRVGLCALALSRACIALFAGLQATYAHYVTSPNLQVRFSDSVEVTATYSAAEYDRRENRRAISPELMTEARKFLLDYKLHEVRGAFSLSLSASLLWSRASCRA